MPIHSPFLRYFHEACKCGSIRLAARRLSVASSAVNRQILKIEDEIGTRLFERTHAGLRLTPAGQQLALHVERTLSDAERTLAAITRDDAGPDRVVIAGQESVIARFLPPALVSLHASRPDTATVFQAAGGTQLLDMVRAGVADIAVAFDPEPDDTIRVVASCRLPVGAVMTPAHPLAGHEALSLADCAAFPIMLPDRSWPLRAKLDDEAARLGVQLRSVMSSNSVEFLKTMVDQQRGIGFQTIVGIEVQIGRRELVHVPLRNPEPVEQVLAICVRRDGGRHAAGNAVAGLLCERIREYEARYGN